MFRKLLSLALVVLVLAAPGLTFAAERGDDAKAAAKSPGPKKHKKGKKHKKKHKKHRHHKHKKNR